VKILSLALLLLARSAQLNSQISTPPIIELRLAVTRATPGYAPRQLGDSTFYVIDSVLFSDPDIRRADTTWSEGRLMVPIRLTSEAAARITDRTKDHVGDRIAVFFNGELTSAIILVSPLVGQSLMLDAVGPPKAQALAAQIVARWPPRR
jgi:preprotein translocase subunit SecD